MHREWQGCRDCQIRGDIVLICSLSPGLAVFPDLAAFRKTSWSISDFESTLTGSAKVNIWDS